MKPFRYLPLLALAGLFQHGAASAALFLVGTGPQCTHPTLASALDAAVANGPGHDEIRVSADAPTTNAHFTITATDVLIAGGYWTCGSAIPSLGARAQVSGNNHDPVFYIGNNRNVELRQLAISNGGRHGIVKGDFAVGGAVWLQDGTAVLRGIRAFDNRARLGGAIAVTGNSVMAIHGGATATEITHNEAMLGGGIYVGERATLRIENDNVLIADNAANGSANWWENMGGGIHATGGVNTASSIEVGWLDADPDLPMRTPAGLVIANNVSLGNGGGVSLYGNTSFNAFETTIRDNTAGDAGGGVAIYGAGIGPGASLQLLRRAPWLPGWLKACEGRYGCSRIENNEARIGGGVMVMHGRLELGQMLLAGNRSTGGGGSAIDTGSIANVVAPDNRIRLQSVVVAGNHCSGQTINSHCATLDMAAGTNAIVFQHVTLADNVLLGGAGVTPFEMQFGSALTTFVARSSIFEPGGSTPLVNGGVAMDADCVMAPTAYGSRPLVRPAPYGFMSRARLDYRPAPFDAAIDACDTAELLDDPLSDPVFIMHGTVDVPGVAERLGPGALADIGAFEQTLVDTLFRDGFGVR